MVVPKYNIVRIFICLGVYASILCLISKNSLFAYQNTATYSKNTPSEVSFLVDSSEVLTIHDITQPEYQKIFDQQQLENPNFGFDPYPYWVRFNPQYHADNEGDEDFVLEFIQNSIDSIDIFIKKGQSEWFKQSTGHAYPPDKSNLGGLFLNFRLKKRDLNETVYLRIRTSGAVSLDFQLYPQKKHYQNSLLKNTFLGVFFGLMFSMAIYNFLIYIFLRDRAYLFYVGATLFGLLTSLVLNGYGYNYLWPDKPQWDSHIYLTFAGLSIVCSSRFAAAFLNLKHFAPKFNNWLWGIAAFGLLLSVLSLIYNATVLLWFGRLLVLIAFPSYIFIGVRSYLRGFRPALYYVMAWLPYVTGLVLVTLRGAGVLGNQIWITYGIEWGGGLEAVLLSLALAARIKTMREQLIKKELEKEQLRTNILEEQKEILQLKVDERTADLQQANATKDRFFAIVAHDLRSPLVALKGVGEKLNHYITKDRKQKLHELGSKIDHSIEHLNHLLNNLLQWASSERNEIQFHPERLKLKPLIQQQLDLYKSNVQAKNISCKLSCSDIEVHADENTFATVLRNVLSNAIKFSPTNGEIAVNCTPFDEEVLITIQDEGSGVSDEFLQDLEQGKVKSAEGSKGEKGFGLGLQLCQQFMNHNQGRFRIKNKKQQGLEVQLFLPLFIQKQHSKEVNSIPNEE